MSAALSWQQARRIALRAQGMGSARRVDVGSAASGRRALARTLERTHLLQIDSVSVFARAHYLPVYTRTGSWDTAVLDRAARPGRARMVREALAHEATFTTAEVHALLEFRRRAVAQRDWGAVREAAGSSPELFARIRGALDQLGPATATEISRHLGDSERGEGWGWRRTSTQWAVEYLFRCGALDCVGRSSQFERLYVPAAEADGLLEAAGDPRGPGAPGTEPPDRTAQDARARLELISRAARSLGIADLGSLADYFRLRVRDARGPVEQLLAAGELREVDVEHPAGRRRMLLHRDAPRPTALRTGALVSPFDPIVFFRPRLKHLFDVDYRIGIYTPAAQRTTGYYSLLFLHGDVIPARVDLRADRGRGVLEVRGTYREPLPQLPSRQRPDQDRVLAALAEELGRAARWQGLGSIEVLTGTGTGELSAALAAQRPQIPAAAPAR